MLVTGSRSSAGGRLFTYRKMEAAVQRVAPGATVATDPGPTPARANSYLDTARVRETLGFTPQDDLDPGVAEYIQWLRTHPL